MKITFIVDKICDNTATEILNRKHTITKFVCSTPGCQASENEKEGWKYANKQLIYDLRHFGYIDLINKNDYYRNDNHSFYLINISKSNHLINQTFWNFMGDDTIEFLKRSNVPILLFYPYEGTGYVEKDVYLNIIKKRNSLGLKNKFIILSLSYYSDINFNKFKFNYLDSILKDFKWVFSLAFLIKYVSKCSYESNLFSTFKNENRLVAYHNYNHKKYNFLCLNNTPTINRLLLLKILYNNKELWNNNLISNRYYTENNNQNLKAISSNVNSLLNQDSLIFNYKSSIDLNEFINMLKNYPFAPIRELENDGIATNDSFKIEWYNDSVFSLVTETLSWKEDNFCYFPVITEKTIKTILQKHPFIIYGYSNSHKLLNSLGFYTFEELLGIPKDLESNNYTMIEKLYHIYNCLLSFNKEKLDIENIKKLTEYNYNHLLNTDWRKLQCDLLLNYEN